MDGERGGGGRERNITVYPQSPSTIRTLDGSIVSRAALHTHNNTITLVEALTLGVLCCDVVVLLFPPFFLRGEDLSVLTASAGFLLRADSVGVGKQRRRREEWRTHGMCYSYYT